MLETRVLLRSTVPNLALLAGLILVFLISAPQISVNGQSSPNIALSGKKVTSVTDGVDVLTGKLENILPLINIQGRGKSGQGLYLPLRNIHWRVMTLGTVYASDRTYTAYKAVQTEPFASQISYATRGGYGAVGKIESETIFAGYYFGGAIPSATNINITMNNGSTIVLRDAATDGQPLDAAARGCIFNVPPIPNPPATCSRGKVFHSTDGSNAIFVADADLYDIIVVDNFSGATSSGSNTNLAGTLYLNDGMRIRFDNSGGTTPNNITKITDRNGNYVILEYETVMGYSWNLLKKVIDSLNREVIINYGNLTSAGFYDEIVYKGFSAAERRIRINYAAVETVMLPGQSLGVPLFPGVIMRCYMLSSGAPCDPGPGGQNGPGAHYATSLTVPSSVVLPNGKKYEFYYNNYLEIARIKTPTGAYTDYSYTGLLGVSADGYIPPQYTGGGSIYRRVGSIKNFDETGQLIKEKTISNTPGESGSTNPLAPPIGYVTMDEMDGAGTLLSRTKHFYHVYQQVYGSAFSWRYGKEYKTEILDPVSQAILRKTETTWEQRASFQWCQAGYSVNALYNCDPVNYPDSPPSVDPRITEIKTTLENGQVSKKTFSYDQYNNPTDVRIYDYGQGSPSSYPLRHTHTEYVTVNPVNGINYVGAIPGNGPHILGLKKLEQLYGVNPQTGTETLSAQTENVYDEGTPAPYGVTIPGWSDPGVARGNSTTVKTWLSTNGTWLASHAGYDQVGNLITASDPLGHQVSFSFADSYADGINNRNTYALLTRITSPVPDPSGAHGSSTSLVTSRTHDFSSGLQTSETNPNNQTVSMEYDDPFERPTKYINPTGGGWVNLEYSDEVGNIYVKKQTALKSSEVSEHYTYSDGFGQAIRYALSEANSWIVMDRKYDALGRVVHFSKPYRTQNLQGATAPVDSWSKIQYDQLGRITQGITPDGASLKRSYNGLKVLLTDQADKQRLLQENVLEEVVNCWEIKASDAQTEPVSFPGHPEVTAGYKTTYQYDPLGNITQSSQGQQTRTMNFDSLSRLNSETHPESGTVTYQYDSNSNLIQRTDARNVTTQFAYDALNRILSLTYSDGTPNVSYTYDDASVPNSRGQITSIGSGAAIYKTLGFDAMGRVTNSAQVTDGRSYMMGYSYNFRGDLLSETYPSGRIVASNYDSAGMLRALSSKMPTYSPKTFASNIGYAEHGAISQLQLGNGRWIHLTYNNRFQATEIGVGTSTTDSSLMKLSYTYGKRDANGNLDTSKNNGNVDSQTIVVPGLSNPLVQRYNYDELDRLKSANEKSGAAQQWIQTFTYDRNGNRAVDTDPTKTTPSLVGADPQIDPATNRIQPRAGEQYQYDQSGNVTRDKDGNTYVYDAENRQKSFYDAANQSSPAAQYVYDGTGLRVKKIVGNEVTVFVYDTAKQLVAEYSTTVSSTQQTSYLVADTLGSPRLNLKSDGTVQARHDYLPFGNEVVGLGGRDTHTDYHQDNVRQKFTGYQQDVETNLSFAQARYYANDHGRFTSPDPFGGSASQDVPQSLNKYAYVLNNPLKYTDPSGLDETFPGYVWIWDKWNQYYFSVPANEADQYRNDPTYRVLSPNENGPDNAFVLTTLEGSYVTPENGALINQNVYRGEDGRFHLHDAALDIEVSDKTDVSAPAFEEESWWGLLRLPDFYQVELDLPFDPKVPVLGAAFQFTIDRSGRIYVGGGGYGGIPGANLTAGYVTKVNSGMPLLRKPTAPETEAYISGISVGGNAGVGFGVVGATVAKVGPGAQFRGAYQVGVGISPALAGPNGAGSVVANTPIYHSTTLQSILY